MIYLKTYNKDSDYLAYRDGDSYGKPNVSYSIDSKAVHYNYPPIDTNGFDFVNLELPSGTLWAACNVGASKPSNYGLYFQWGDTSGYTSSQIGTGSGKKMFAKDFSDYKWYSGGTFTKYTTIGATLDLEDDAAYAYMGGDWYMPTYDQLIELRDNTTNKVITQNGVKGRLLTSKANPSKSIFIPMAGSVLNGSNSSIRDYGFIWPSTLGSTDINYAWWLGVNPNGVSVFGKDVRSFGLSVRGVI